MVTQNGEIKWLLHDNKIKFQKDASVTVDKLEPDTEYLFQVLLHHKNKTAITAKQDSELLKTFKATTTCKSKENICFMYYLSFVKVRN